MSWPLEIILQLTLEQHRFQLHGSTYRWFLFHYLHYYVYDPWLVESVDTDSADTEGWLKDLSIHGLWCLQSVLEPMPCRYWGKTVLVQECVLRMILHHGGRLFATSNPTKKMNKCFQIYKSLHTCPQCRVFHNRLWFMYFSTTMKVYQ